MKQSDKLREELANLCHTNTIALLAVVLSKCHENLDGSLSINDDSVEKWNNMIKTPFNDLTEDRKKSAYLLADKIMKIINE